MNGDKDGGKMLSTYRCAPNVREMTTKEVGLQKKISLTIPSFCGPVCYAIEKVFRTLPGRLKKSLQLCSEHRWKRDVSLKTIRPQSAQFLLDRA